MAMAAGAIAMIVVLFSAAGSSIDLGGNNRPPLAKPDADAVLAREREQEAAERRERAERRRERAEAKRRPDPATEQASPGLDGPGQGAPGNDPSTAEAPELPQPSSPAPAPAPAGGATPQPSPSAPVDPRYY